VVALTINQSLTLSTNTTLSLTPTPTGTEVAAGKLTWCVRDRAAEMTKLIADYRSAMPSPTDYSVSPDDVHNALP
jgi:hypothetical protein